MSDYGGVLVSFPSVIVTSWDWAVVPHVETYPTSSLEGCLVGAFVRVVFWDFGGRAGAWAGRVRERHCISLGERGLLRVSPFEWSPRFVTGGHATSPTFSSNSFVGMWFWV